MKKIGLMGGTFEPIHVGHILLGRCALECYGLDEVWFMPTGVSYLKEGRQMLSAEARLELTRLAISDEPGFRVTDVETKRPGRTYTVDTLKELRGEYPEDHFYFICGADSLEYMENWYHPEGILSNCEIIAACRNGSDVEYLKEIAEKLLRNPSIQSTYPDDFGGRIHVMEFPNFEISSTDIRRRIKEGRSIRYLVPDPVIREITEKGYFHEG
jgi:nicotinate-nucleotide adenylyltransferase